MYTTRLTELVHHTWPCKGCHTLYVFDHNHLTCYWPSFLQFPLPLIPQQLQENILEDDLSLDLLTVEKLSGSETGLWPYLIIYELLQAEAQVFGIITSYIQDSNAK